MSDMKIKERLRHRASVARREGTGTALGDAMHFEEAADRIEEMDAEIDRFRDVLAWYAEHLCEGLCLGDGRIAKGIGEDVCAGCRARAALKEIDNG